MNNDESTELRIESTAEVPNCPQCSSPGLISALVPHTIHNARGVGIPGSSVAVLCPSCDAQDPVAGAVITFFTVHGAVSEETLAEAAPLLEAWARTAVVKPVDLERLHVEYTAWLADEL